MNADKDRFAKAQWRFILCSMVAYAFFYITRKNLSMAQPEMFAQNVITKEALGSLGIMVPYVDIEATTTIRENGNGVATAWSGALVNLKEANFTRQFAAVSYITVDGVTYYGSYSSEDNARSISEIAAAIIADLNSDYNLGIMASDKAALVEKYAGIAAN